MKRYRHKKQYGWSAPIAYSVGLIASDGSLSKDGRHIDLTSTDIEQLRNFARAIGRESIITPKSTGRLDRAGKQAYRIQFSDTAYYDFLSNVGLTPNKSSTISELAIPDCFWAHFLRGLFDGDGCFYGYYDKRWPLSFMFYMTIVSASRTFIDYVSNCNAQLLKVGKGSIRKSRDVYMLSYAKSDTMRIAYCMYAEAGTFYLTRKKRKLQGFIQEAKYATIGSNARVL